MDTKALRQKILDLAIHGRLVPQDPTDEPASVLLQRIREEKERLVKEGKIKKGKKTKEDGETGEHPYVLPKGWVWCKMEDIAYVASGSTPAKENFVQNGIPYIKMYNLRNQQIDFEFKPQYITEEVHNGKLRRSRTEIGDLIMNIVGPPLGKLAIVPSTLPQANFNQAAVLIRPYLYKDVINNYLKNYLEEMSEINSITTRGCAGQVNISLTQSQNLKIPLPPLAEQRRIVSEIERWFGLIDKIESGKADLKATVEQAKSKILDLAIHGKLVPQDPSDEPAAELLRRINPKAEITSENEQYGKVPMGWCITKVKDVFMINPKNKKDDAVPAGFVPMSNISDGFSNQFSYEMKFWGNIKSGFTHFADGDIAVAKISPCLENRKSMVLEKLPSGIGAGTTELLVFRPLCLIALYGLYFFKSDCFIKQCVGTFNGVVGQQRVGKNIVEQISFPLPPLAEQHRIVEKIAQLFAQLDRIAAEL